MTLPREDLWFAPQMVVHLAVHFDPTLQVDEAPDNTQVLTDADRRGADVVRQQLGGEHVGQAPAVSVRQRVTHKPLLTPLSNPALGLSLITGRVPMKGSVELPGVRQAGKFNLQFDFRDLPLDPRLIDDCAIEIHLGCVAPETFAEGMSSGQGAQLPRQITRRVLRTSRGVEVEEAVGIGFTDDETLVLYGTVDTWTVEHEGRSTVSVEGRDLRGFLLDAKVPMQRMAELDLSKSIDSVVKDILGTLSSRLSLKAFVSINADEWPNRKIPSPVTQDGLTRVRLDSDGQGTGKSSGAGSGQDKLSYWDLITRYCTLVGAVPYMRGQYIWIRPARRIFDMIEDRSQPTPFAGGKERVARAQDSTGASWDDIIRVRRLVYGRNIEKLSFERKYAQAAPIVEVVSIDDRVRGESKLLIAQWPPKGSLAAALKGDTDEADGDKPEKTQSKTTASSSSSGGSDRVLLAFPCIRSLAQLQQVAQDIYEEIGRGEMGGNCSTHALTSFGGDFSDPDMLRLRPGDAVEFLVDAGLLQSRGDGRGQPPLAPAEPLKMEALPFADAVRQIAERLPVLADGGRDTNLARAIVASSRSRVVGDLRWFRVSNVKYDWSTSGGVSVAFDFQNYIVSAHKAVTADPATQVRPTPDPAMSTTGPTSTPVEILSYFGVTRAALQQEFLRQQQILQGSQGGTVGTEEGADDALAARTNVTYGDRY
jgi:hypothetical protein